MHGHIQELTSTGLVLHCCSLWHSREGLAREFRSLRNERAVLVTDSGAVVVLPASAFLSVQKSVAMCAPGAVFRWTLPLIADLELKMISG